MFCQLFSLQNKSFLYLQHVENKGFQTVIKHRLKAIQKPIKNELEKREKNTKNAHFVLKKCTFRFRDYKWLEITDYKSIIEKNFSNDVFAETFGIPLSDKATSKKEKLSWLSLIEPQKGKKKMPMTKSDVNKLWMILDHLNNFKSTED